MKTISEPEAISMDRRVSFSQKKGYFRDLNNLAGMTNLITVPCH